MCASVEDMHTRCTLYHSLQEPTGTVDWSELPLKALAGLQRTTFFSFSSHAVLLFLQTLAMLENAYASVQERAYAMYTIPQYWRTYCGVV